MAEVVSDTGETEKGTVEVELLGDCPQEGDDLAANYMCFSSDLDSNILQSNLFNTQIASPFLEEHMQKSMLKSKRISEFKEGVPDAIHKVPSPIRKALRIGRFRRVI